MHNGYVYIIYIYNNRKIWISLVDMYHKKTPKNSYIRFRLAVKYSQCPLIYSSREDKCGTPDSRKGFASRSGTINWTRTSLTLRCQGYASHLQHENMAVAELALQKQTQRMWKTSPPDGQTGCLGKTTLWLSWYSCWPKRWNHLTVPYYLGISPMW